MIRLQQAVQQQPILRPPQVPHPVPARKAAGTLNK